MKKRQELYTRILNLVVDFKEPFTLEELYKTLREKKILTDKNKKDIVDTIDKVFESPFIKSVPFTNKFLVI